MHLSKAFLFLALVLFTSKSSMAQRSETIYGVSHFSLSVRAIQLIGKNDLDDQYVSVLGGYGGQLQLVYYHPLSPLYGVEVGVIHGVESSFIQFNINSLESQKVNMALHTLSFPIYLSGVFLLPRSWLINVKMGVGLSYSDGGIIEKSEIDDSILTIEMDPNYLQVGTMMELCAEYTFRSGRTFLIGLIGNVNVTNQFDIDYEIESNTSGPTVSGGVPFSGNYIGLQLGYVFPLPYK